MAKSFVKQFAEVKERMLANGFTVETESKVKVTFTKCIGSVEFYVNLARAYGTDNRGFHAFAQGSYYQTQTMAVCNAETAIECLNGILTCKYGEVTIAQITGII
jgi:hypothetical protein